MVVDSAWRQGVQTALCRQAKAGVTDVLSETAVRERFWENYSLGELSNEEWEALCDGCGKCCLKREMDGDRVTVYGVACPLLDVETARCKDYPNRLKKVPDCDKLTARTVSRYKWLPDSCAYRRLDEGKPLPKWHPLLVGDDSLMQTLGISVSGYAVSSADVPRRRLKKHVIARHRI